MLPTRDRWLAAVTLAVGVVVMSLAAVLVIGERQTVTTVDDAVAAFRADHLAPPSPTATSGPEPVSPTGPSEAPAATAPPITPVPSQRSAQELPTGAAPPAPSQDGPGGQDQAVAGEPVESEPAAERRPRLGLPEEGVYTYATDGGESIDALGGAHHEYPDESTITVRHSDCGFVTRWEPLRERWEEFDSCQDGDRAWMRTITLYHEFFGRGVRHQYTCGEAATLADVSVAPGDRWSWDCHTDGGSMHTVVEIVGFAARDVGGRSVDAVHVRYDITMTGSTRGTRQADVWFDRWSQLELHGTYETDAMVDTPTGSSRYVEQLTRTLVDLRPRR